jgi:hypothetical protein
MILKGFEVLLIVYVIFGTDVRIEWRCLNALLIMNEQMFHQDGHIPGGLVLERDGDGKRINE